MPAQNITSGEKKRKGGYHNPLEGRKSASAVEKVKRGLFSRARTGKPTVKNDGKVGV